MGVSSRGCLKELPPSHFQCAHVIISSDQPCQTGSGRALEASVFAEHGSKLKAHDVGAYFHTSQLTMWSSRTMAQDPILHILAPGRSVTCLLFYVFASLAGS